MDYSNSRLNAKRTRRHYKSKAKKTKNKVMVIIIRIVLILLAVLFFSGIRLIFGAYEGIINNSPKLEDIFSRLNLDENYSTIIVSAQTGLEVDRLDGGESREYVSSSQIPKIMKDAMVAIEDERFYQHDGVDFKGLFRILYMNLTTPNTQGASTITQQVIKNKLGIMRNTIESKLQEQVLAVEFEKELIAQLGSKERAKDHILTTYLNGIGLGHGQIGVQAAALYYFDKNVWELTISECATIAAITSNPVKRSPIRMPENNKQRQEAVLDKMLELGFITQAEHEEAMADDVYARIQEVGQIASMQPSYHSYYVDSAILQVVKRLQEEYNMSSEEAYDAVYNRGLRIEIPQDPHIQQIVDNAYMNEDLFPKTEFEIEVTYSVRIKNSLTGLTRTYSNNNSKGVLKSWDDVEPYIEGIKNKILREGDEIVEGSEQIYKVVQPQSAFIVIDYHTGYVMAVAGSRGEKLTNMAFNRATNAIRQPGSTFKVISSYAPALDLGIITPGTILDDVPFYIKEGSPGNEKTIEWPSNWYSTGYEGLSTVRRAIYRSMNVLAVKTLDRLGLSNSFKYLDNFGFTTITERDRNLSLALGGIDGVTQIELAAAYGTIANGGLYNEPVFFTKVLDHNGNIILENEVKPQRVLKESTAFILTDMMKDTLTVGTGAKARLTVNMPHVGKTGTTSDTRDLVFAGYTPYYVATVWLGYDRPKNLNKKTTDDKIHLVLWQTIMDEIHRDLPYKEFNVPESVKKVTICDKSGMLPVKGLCSSTVTEYFEIGTEPTEQCTVHVRFEWCVGNGGERYVATEYCPEDHIVPGGGVAIIRPEPYTGSQGVRDRWLELPRECPVHTESYHYIPDYFEQEDSDENIYYNGPEDQEEQPVTTPSWEENFAPFTTPTPVPQDYFPPIPTPTPDTSLILPPDYTPMPTPGYNPPFVTQSP